MDTLMLQRDEATRDRVRQALEFLDPRRLLHPFSFSCCPLLACYWETALLT
jgi:hypothetical protein